MKSKYKFTQIDEEIKIVEQKSNLVNYTITLSPQQIERLKALAEKTNVKPRVLGRLLLAMKLADMEDLAEKDFERAVIEIFINSSVKKTKAEVDLPEQFRSIYKSIIKSE